MDLFSSSDRGNTRPNTSRSDSAALLLPTNVPNLRHYRSRGYVAPKNSFGEEDKYYEDLLALAPGRLPLLRPPVSAEVVEYVQQESKRSARPVFIEVVVSELAATEIPALDARGNPVEARPDAENLLAVAPPLVIPFDGVRRIHFLSETDMQETVNRPFSNIREFPESKISVSPSIQGETPLNLDALQSWLTDLDISVAPDPQRFIDADKTAGAIALMSNMAQDLKDDLLELLNGGDGIGENEVPSWIRTLRTDEAPKANEEQYEDKLIFTAVSSALREKTPKTLRPRRTLEEIEGELLNTDELSEEERATLGKLIERTDSILANETHFKKMKNDNYPALQGLMFFLIKVKPEPLLEWSPDDTGSTREAHLTSAAYCGLLYGHASLPLEFRSEGLDRSIARRVADRLSQFSSLPRVGQDQMETGRKVDKTDQVVESLLSEDLNSDGPMREIALSLCREMEWEDCVETVIISRDRRSAETYITKEGGNNRKLKMAWRLPGMVDVSYELDVQGFRDHVEKTEIPQSVLQNIIDRYEEKID